MNKVPFFARAAEFVFKDCKIHYRLLRDSVSQVSSTGADFAIGRLVLIIAILLERKINVAIILLLRNARLISVMMYVKIAMMFYIDMPQSPLCFHSRSSVV